MFRYGKTGVTLLYRMGNIVFDYNTQTRRVDYIQQVMMAVSQISDARTLTFCYPNGVLSLLWLYDSCHTTPTPCVTHNTILPMHILGLRFFIQDKIKEPTSLRDKFMSV